MMKTQKQEESSRHFISSKYPRQSPDQATSREHLKRSLWGPSCETSHVCYNALGPGQVSNGIGTRRKKGSADSRSITVILGDRRAHRPVRYDGGFGLEDH